MLWKKTNLEHWQSQGLLSCVMTLAPLTQLYAHLFCLLYFAHCVCKAVQRNGSELLFAQYQADITQCVNYNVL